MDFLRRLLRKQHNEHPVELRQLHAALKAHHRSARIEADHVRLASGVRVRTQLIETHAFSNGGVRTATATLTSHGTAFPDGLYEYQHAIGADVESALHNGFDTWARTDLVAILDALAVQPEHCTTMELDLPSDAEQGPRCRQIVFGPTARYAASPAVEEADHGFCPCCLFTNSRAAFQSNLAADGVFGIRIFVNRDSDGEFTADCRVNGQDHPEALPLLIEYARSWPGEGNEFRKQYVVIRDKP